MKKLLLVATAFMLLCTGADAKGAKKTARKSSHKKEKPTYYVNGDGTYSTSPAATDATRPSPYKGNKVPENDGVKKNKERNLNYTSQPPATDK